MTRVRKFLINSSRRRILILFTFRYDASNDCPLHCWILLHVRLLHRGDPRLLEDLAVQHHGLSHPDADRLPVPRGRDGSVARRGALGEREDQGLQRLPVRAVQDELERGKS